MYTFKMKMFYETASKNSHRINQISWVLRELNNHLGFLKPYTKDYAKRINHIQFQRESYTNTDYQKMTKCKWQPTPVFLQRVGHNWATKHSQTQGPYQSKFNQRNRISRRYTVRFTTRDWLIWLVNLKFSGQAIRMIRVKRSGTSWSCCPQVKILLLAAAVLILGALTDWIRHIRLFSKLFHT